ncbi:MAG: hypothetical protein M1817_002979 [Caeruleum heppii]|nr:MAG: hypothetical protein M1817_002979 [Caeruleum heppii]
MSSTPSSILIVGSGAFGLSTALALTARLAYARTTITLLDRCAFPAPDCSSVDTSRIIRADYSDPAYARLAARAQDGWRRHWGAKGRYTESGLLLTAEEGHEGYVRASFENVRRLAKEAGKDETEVVEELASNAEIRRASGTGGGSGTWGYINRRSGWVDAEAALRYAREKVEATQRVTFRTGEVVRLIYGPPLPTSSSSSSSSQPHRAVHGVHLRDRTTLHADLTILACGAWTPSLIDLSGLAQATGQVLAYLPLTPAEHDSLRDMPVMLNFSTGMFVMPPTKDGVLKVARHAYGYTNPRPVPNPEENTHEETILASLPRTLRDDPNLTIPAEGLTACLATLAQMVPSLALSPSRSFSHTRLCWYTDTPTGDFLISPHPNYTGLFVATGGSGHGFKYLPVIGEAVVDILRDRPERKGGIEEDLRRKWRWPTEEERGMRGGRLVDGWYTEDGSRGGERGMVLEVEMAKGRAGRRPSKL